MDLWAHRRRLRRPGRPGALPRERREPEAFVRPSMRCAQEQVEAIRGHGEPRRRRVDVEMAIVERRRRKSVLRAEPAWDPKGHPRLRRPQLAGGLCEQTSRPSGQRRPGRRSFVSSHHRRSEMKNARIIDRRAVELTGNVPSCRGDCPAGGEGT